MVGTEQEMSQIMTHRTKILHVGKQTKIYIHCFNIFQAICFITVTKALISSTISAKTFHLFCFKITFKGGVEREICLVQVLSINIRA